MSGVLNAFLSTWSSARSTFGEGSPQVGATYGLEEAAQAQTDLQERRTTGKLLLDPARLD